MKEVAALIAQVGFPSAVAGYLLITFRKTLQELRDAVHDLASSIKKGE